MNQSESVIGEAFSTALAFTIILVNCSPVSAGETIKTARKALGGMHFDQQKYNEKYFGGYKPLPQSLSSFLLGTTKQKQGHFRESLRAFDQAIAIDPKFASAYVMRGRSFLELDDHASAMPDFTRAIQLAPTHWLAYKLRGRIFFEKNDLQKSLADYSSAAKYATAPEDKAEMFKNQGKIYSNFGKSDLAISAFSQSIALEPYNARSAVMLRGNEYFKTRQYQKAVDDYTKAIAYDDMKAQDKLYSLRANAYEKLGKQDLARKDRLKAKNSVKDSWGDVLKDMDKRGF